MGAEGARDRVLALCLETLRQKDCCKQNPWRDLEEVAEGVSPPGDGQSLRHKYRGNQCSADSPCLFLGK